MPATTPASPSDPRCAFLKLSHVLVTFLSSRGIPGMINLFKCHFGDIPHPVEIYMLLIETRQAGFNHQEPDILRRYTCKEDVE